MRCQHRGLAGNVCKQRQSRSFSWALLSSFAVPRCCVPTERNGDPDPAHWSKSVPLMTLGSRFKGRQTEPSGGVCPAVDANRGACMAPVRWSPVQREPLPKRSEQGRSRGECGVRSFRYILAYITEPAEGLIHVRTEGISSPQCLRRPWVALTTVARSGDGPVRGADTYARRNRRLSLSGPSDEAPRAENNRLEWP